MLEIIVILALLCAAAATVAWQLRPADMGQIVGYRQPERVQLDHELGIELAGVNLPPDFGPPPPAATFEQHTNRIYIDD